MLRLLAYTPKTTFAALLEADTYAFLQRETWADLSLRNRILMVWFHWNAMTAHIRARMALHVRDGLIEQRLHKEAGVYQAKHKEAKARAELMVSKLVVLWAFQELLTFADRASPAVSVDFTPEEVEFMRETLATGAAGITSLIIPNHPGLTIEPVDKRN